MATVLFDVDSTVITCESLEKILQNKLRGAELQEFKKITEMGLKGEIPFPESLQRRLALARPTLADTLAIGNKMVDWITPGIEELIEELHAKNIQIWLVSGGLFESLIPLAKKLAIPKSQVIGVQLIWSSEGACLGLDPNDKSSQSKADACREVKSLWSKPTIAVGDAASDWRLFEEGLVDHFLLFTPYFKAHEILAKGAEEAATVTELKQRIFDYAVVSQK